MNSINAEETKDHSLMADMFMLKNERMNGLPVTATEKIRLIETYFGKIMEILGLDLNDDSLRNTPMRVAKMYINELFSGLDPKNEPAITLFDNKYSYRQMVIEKNIPFYSTCEHHFVPIIGKAHIAYIPGRKMIGLSKLNRIVHYFSKRPQVQERLTVEIAGFLKKALNTEDVAVLISAEHLCVASRGVKDADAITITSSFNGEFLVENKANEFFNHLNAR
ncbi:MAG TPA: GTP cyclohydrolase I FolE [Flavisolibacter sp.]|jgi:GTP cyclohydrolase I|nr:GTP cyclohydrolase I FolE [Flavisolibacter sp.]